jgi:hypothetical protein
LTEIFIKLTALVVAIITFWHVIQSDTSDKAKAAADVASVAPTTPVAPPQKSIPPKDDPCSAPFDDRPISCLRKE